MIDFRAREQSEVNVSVGSVERWKSYDKEKIDLFITKLWISLPIRSESLQTQGLFYRQGGDLDKAQNWFREKQLIGQYQWLTWLGGHIFFTIYNTIYITTTMAPMDFYIYYKFIYSANMACCYSFSDCYSNISAVFIVFIKVWKLINLIKHLRMNICIWLACWNSILYYIELSI